MASRIRVLAVVGLLVLAGCTGMGGSGDAGEAQGGGDGARCPAAATGRVSPSKRIPRRALAIAKHSGRRRGGRPGFARTVVVEVENYAATAKQLPLALARPADT